MCYALLGAEVKRTHTSHVEYINNGENRFKKIIIIGKSNYNCGECYIYPDIT